MSTFKKSRPNGSRKGTRRDRSRAACRPQGSVNHLGFEILEERRLLSINQPPVNIVPGWQEAVAGVPFAFTAFNGNRISTADVDAGSSGIKVSLRADQGTLSFAYPNPPSGAVVYLVGDGADDPNIVFQTDQATAREVLSWVVYRPASHTQWVGNIGGNGHWYRYFPAQTGVDSWSAARDFAEARGGYLASVTSQAERNFIAGLIPGDSGNVWLGGFQDRNSPSYSEPSGGWKWVSGESWGFTDWAAGEPNNSGNLEDWLEMTRTSGLRWNDHADVAAKGFIVEWDSSDLIANYVDQLTLTVNDQGANGTGGAEEDSDIIPIQVRSLRFANEPHWTTTAAQFDNGYNSNGRKVFNVSQGTDYIHELKQLDDGKILAVGAVNNHFGVLRFNPDLSLDSTFGNGGVVESNFGEGRHAFTVCVDPQGRYLVGGMDYLARYLPNGQLDSSFAGSGRVVAGNVNPVYSVSVQPDGKILATGSDGAQFRLNRYLPDGSTDATWSFHDSGNSPRGLQVDAYGDVLLAGRNSSDNLRVSRISTNGALEASYTTTTPSGWFYYSLALPDGKMLMVGESANDVLVTRHHASGELDTSFGIQGQRKFSVLNARELGLRASLQADGKILVTGGTHNGSNWDVFVARMSYDGQMDTSFNSNGIRVFDLGSDDFGQGVVYQANGKVALAGRSGGTMFLARLWGDNDRYGEFNSPPTLSPIKEVATSEDIGSVLVPLRGITAGGGETQELRVTASTDSPGFITALGINYVSANTTGTLQFTPAENKSGIGWVTVIVEDSGQDGNLQTTGDNKTYRQSFRVVVAEVNDLPTINPIDDFELGEDHGELTVALGGIGAGRDEAQPLRISAQSSDPGIIPHPLVNYVSPEATGTLRLETLPSVSGSVEITVVVEDAGPDGSFDHFLDNQSYSRVFSVLIVPEPQISVLFPQGPVAEANSGLKQVFFSVELSASYLFPVQVNYATSSLGNQNSATPTNDYLPVSGQLQFAPGETQKIVAVSVRGDRQVEFNEIFGLLLSSPVNGTLADDFAEAIITDDDNWAYPLAIDFGTEVSPVQSGAAAVGSLPFSTSKGLGWTSGLESLRIVDRGTGVPAFRDIALTPNSAFGFVVPNGQYFVRITLGDSSRAHEQMRIRLEGAAKPAVSTLPNEFKTRAYVVDVTDGQLDLAFQDLGGNDPDVAIAAIDFRRR